MFNRSKTEAMCNQLKSLADLMKDLYILESQLEFQKEQVEEVEQGV